MNNMPFVAGEEVSDSRRDDESMFDIGEEEQQRSRAVWPATRRAEVTLADLFVACRRAIEQKKKRIRAIIRVIRGMYSTMRVRVVSGSKLLTENGCF